MLTKDYCCQGTLPRPMLPRSLVPGMWMSGSLRVAQMECNLGFGMLATKIQKISTLLLSTKKRKKNKKTSED